MVREATNAEYLLTHKRAEEYRNRGYKVSLEVPLDFLPGFRADLGREARPKSLRSSPARLWLPYPK